MVLESPKLNLNKTLSSLQQLIPPLCSITFNKEEPISFEHELYFLQKKHYLLQEKFAKQANENKGCIQFVSKDMKEEECIKCSVDDDKFLASGKTVQIKISNYTTQSWPVEGLTLHYQ